MLKMLHTYVSHDVMQPIQNNLFFMDRMLACGLGGEFDEMRRFHSLGTWSAKQVSSRVKDLLDQTLIEQNAFVPLNVEFSPHALVDQIKSQLEGTLHGCDVVVAKRISEDMPELLRGDVDRINQVL